MEIARTFQVICPSCNMPGLVRLTFFEKCILGKCAECESLLMFCKHSKYCRKCEAHAICLLEHPILVGDDFKYVKEKTKDEKNKAEPFKWAPYSSLTKTNDCV